MAIKRRDLRFAVTEWIRTCQECGNVQVSRPPSNPVTDSYRFSKCKKCKSESLDYGTENGYEDFEDEN